MSKIQVIAAVIVRDGKFLLGKRSPDKRSAPNYWCPVSGRVENGETQEEAVVREVMEEVGLLVAPIKRVDTFDSNDGSAQIHWWLVEIISGQAFLKNDEHTELLWVTIEEMRLLHPIFEEDIMVFQKITSSSCQ